MIVYSSFLSTRYRLFFLALFCSPFPRSAYGLPFLLGIAALQVLATHAERSTSPIPLAAIDIAGHHSQPQNHHTRSQCLPLSWQEQESATNKNGQTTKTTKNVARPDGVTGWHPRKLDYRALTVVGELQPGRLLLVTHSDFETGDGNSVSTPVLAKMVDVDVPDDERASLLRDVSREAAMYRRLHGADITPEFLGHVVDEAGHAIGFLVEYIEQSLKARQTPEKMRACLAVLSSLHEHHIVHGDAHDGNCILRDDGNGGTSAVLLDFELAEEAASEAAMARDIRIMDRCIRAIERAPDG